MERDVPIDDRVYLSHPSILLRDHLHGVSQLAARYLSESLRIEGVEELGRLAGLTHDIGKYSRGFQAMLRARMKGKKAAKAPHSQLSSLAAAIESMERLEDPVGRMAVYLSVRYHHGMLPSLEIAVRNLESDLTGPDVWSQLKSMANDEVESELKDLGLDAAVSMIRDPDSARKKLRDFLRMMGAIYYLGARDMWNAYYTILLTYSSLVDADRRDAAQVLQRGRTPIPTDLVRRYREIRFRGRGGRMKGLRERLFREVDRLPPDHRMITISAPTGSGKTLSGFHLALKMRDERRVVYSLPFINVIEQNYEVLRDAISLHIEDPGPEVILKKHHLTLPEPKEGMSLEETLLLADAFDSEVVVTTFVQLLRTLFSNSPSVVRKLHNLANSVLILDEVQSIPAEYWLLIRKALESLSRLTNSKIILMTATMPALLGRELEGVRMTQEGMSRYTLRYRPDIGDVDALTDLASEILSRRRSLLVVMNTIRTSIEAYRMIKEHLSGEYEVHYLSSNIVPVERARRIGRIRQALEDGRPVVCVSTQVVEAGVDLDFEAVIRDVAPLDSIVQSAGRCNRNARMDSGEVHVVLIDGGKPARWVYGSILILGTQKLLADRPTLEEAEIPHLLDSYYRDVEDRVDVKRKSENYMKALDQLDFKFLSTFSPIEEGRKFSVFVELDDGAEVARRRFEDAYGEFIRTLRGDSDLREIFRMKAELRARRIDVESYVINVRDPRGLPEWIGNMRIVERDVLDAYYDLETGFKVEGEEDTIW